MPGKETRELVPVGPPTELDLFRLSVSQREDILRLDERGQSLSRDLAINRRRSNENQSLTNERQERLNAIKIEQEEAAYQFSSYVTTSAAYIKIHSDLSAQGVSEVDILDFFQKTLFVAHEYSSRYSILYNTSLEAALRKEKAAEVAGYPEYKRAIRKVTEHPPAWYNKSKNEWEKLIHYYRRLNDLLGQQNDKNTFEVETDYGFVSPKWIPDWLEDVDGTSPDISLIDNELQEDLEERTSVVAYLNLVRKQQEDLHLYSRGKFLKSVLNLEKRRRDLFPGNGNLSDLLVYLSATEEMHEHTVGLDQIQGLITREQFAKQVLAPNVSREKTIEFFSQEMSVGQEIMALWLERKLRDAGLSAKTVLDEGLTAKLGLFGNPEELKGIREADRKFFNVYNFDLAPLFGLLKDDEGEILRQVITDSKGNTVESVIWEMANVFSDRIQNSDDPQVKKTVGEIRKFGANWIKNNWKWGYEELMRTLTQGPREVILRPQILPDETEIETPEEKQTEVVMESLSRQVSTGNLGNWEVYYTNNMRVGGGEFIQVIGDTLEDKEGSLDEILLREGHQVSIKTSSVINALDWVVMMPPDILAKRSRKVVNGEDFIKIKRGAARVLLQMDRDNRQIFFFLHQKKDYYYKF